jgi:transposase
LPARRLSVRKIKEVLRLRFELGLGLRAIARSCSIGLGTAHEYLQRAEAAGVTWPLGEDWDEDRLEAALFGGRPRVRPTALPMPDFAELHRQRQQHAHVTQQLLWEEYRQANPDGYRYSRYVAAAFMLRNRLKAMTDVRTGDFNAT